MKRCSFKKLPLNGQSSWHVEADLLCSAFLRKAISKHGSTINPPDRFIQLGDFLLEQGKIFRVSLIFTLRCWSGARTNSVIRGFWVSNANERELRDLMMPVLGWPVEPACFKDEYSIPVNTKQGLGLRVPSIDSTSLQMIALPRGKRNVLQGSGLWQVFAIENHKPATPWAITSRIELLQGLWPVHVWFGHWPGCFYEGNRWIFLVKNPDVSS